MSSRQIDWNVVFNFKAGNSRTIVGLFEKLRKEMQTLGDISPFIQWANDAKKYSSEISILHKKINALNKAASEQIGKVPGSAAGIRATIAPLKAEMLGDVQRLREKRDVIKGFNLKQGSEEAAVLAKSVEEMMAEALRRHNPFKAVTKIMIEANNELTRVRELQTRLTIAGLEKHAKALEVDADKLVEMSMAAVQATARLDKTFKVLPTVAGRAAGAPPGSVGRAVSGFDRIAELRAQAGRVPPARPEGIARATALPPGTPGAFGRNARKAFEQLNKVLAITRKRIDDFADKLAKTGRHLRNFGRNLQFTARDIMFTVGFLGAFAVVGVNSFKKVEEAAFDLTLALGVDGNTGLGAAIKSNHELISQNFQLVREYGATLEETGRALTTFAQVGITEVTARTTAMTVAFQMAIITGGEVSTATDVLTDVFLNFRDTIDDSEASMSEKIQHFSNVLTAATLNSKLSLSELKTALQLTSGVATTYGLTLEEVTAAVTTLGDAGVPASIASRRLASSLDTLFTKGRDYVPDLIDPMTGGFVSMGEALTNLKARYESFGTEMDRAGFLSELFGAQQAEVMKKLFNNTESFNEYVQELEATDESIMALTDDYQPLHLQLKILEGTFGELSATIGGGIVTQLEQSKVILKLSDSIAKVAQSGIIEKFASGIGSSLVGFGKVAIKVLDDLAEHVVAIKDAAEEGFELGKAMGKTIGEFIRALNVPYIQPLLNVIALGLEKLGELFDKVFGKVTMDSIEGFGSILTTIAVALVSLVPILAAAGLAVEILGVGMSVLAPGISAIGKAGDFATASVKNTQKAVVGAKDATVNLITGLVSGLAALAIGIIKYGGALKAGLAAVGAAISAVGVTAASVIVALVTLITGIIVGFVQAFTEMFGGIQTEIDLVAVSLQAVIDIVMIVLGSIFQLLRIIFEIGRVIGAVLGGVIAGFLKPLLKLIDWLIKGFLGLVNIDLGDSPLAVFFDWLLNVLTDIWNLLMAIPNALGGVADFFGGVADSIIGAFSSEGDPTQQNLGGRHGGGIVHSSFGRNSSALLKNKEMVLTESQQAELFQMAKGRSQAQVQATGAGGMVNHFNIYGENAEEIAEKVEIILSTKLRTEQII